MSESAARGGETESAARGGEIESAARGGETESAARGGEIVQAPFGLVDLAECDMLVSWTVRALGGQMSIAEIQDNKWEVQASKPNLTSVASIGGIVMMTGFILFFVALIIGAVRGTFTDSDGLKVDQGVGSGEKAAPAAE